MWNGLEDGSVLLFAQLLAPFQFSENSYAVVNYRYNIDVSYTLKEVRIGKALQALSTHSLQLLGKKLVVEFRLW
jgi:hypothetical protein